MANKKIKQFYKEEGNDLPDYQRRLYFSESSNKWSIDRYNTVTKLIDLMNKSHNCNSLLELGCANGFYLREALRHGYTDRLVGVEISDRKLQNAVEKDKIFYILADWDEIGFIRKNFDVVLLSETIEHSEDPKELVRKAMEWGKYVIATVPTSENLKEDPFNKEHGGVGHLHAFRHDTFLDLFKGAAIVYEQQEKHYSYIIVKTK